MAERWLGALLLSLICAAFVGEGLAVACAIALCVALVVVERRDDAFAASRGPMAAPLIALLAAFVLPLLVDAPLGAAHGLGRLLMWLVLPSTYLSARRVPQEFAERIDGAIVLAGLTAVGFGAYSMVHTMHSIESLVRLDGATSDQGLVPGSAARVMGGFYFHRLKMAHALLVALACSLSRCLFVPQNAAMASLLARLGAFVTLFCALALTYTRAAFGAALLATTLCCIARYGRASALTLRATSSAEGKPSARALIVPLLASAAIVACLVGLPDVRARLMSAKDASAQETRAVIWRQAIDIVSAHPLGVGVGQYPSYAQRGFERSDPLTLSPRTYPHHTLLGVWAEGGPVAVFALLAMCSRVFGRAWETLRASRQSAAAKRSAVALIFLLTAFFCVGLMHDVFFHQSVVIALFATTGALYARMSP